MPKLLGTFLPLTALKSSKYPDDLFKAGMQFIDWLSDTGQNSWQMLPLHQTDWNATSMHGSPYSSYGIGLNPRYLPPKTWEKELPSPDEEFLERNKDWIEDYALFLALSEEYQTDHWPEWPESIRLRDPEQVVKNRKILKNKIIFYIKQQAFLYSKFQELKIYAENKNIELMGDLPFYLPTNSPLVWQFQKQFEIDKEGRLPYFSGALGGKHFARQPWGHPLYNWNNEANMISLINLWKLRLSNAATQFNWARLDSAIRFYKYAKLNAVDHKEDVMEEALGDKAFIPLLEYSLNELDLKIFCEDISPGLDMRGLERTLNKYEIPGISVFTMSIALSEDYIDKNYFNIEKLSQKHLYYTSSHDTQTLIDYLRTLNIKQKRIIIDVLKITNTSDDRMLAQEVKKYLINNAKYIVIPFQDWFLKTERINTPGTYGPQNWSYKMHLPIEDLPRSLDF